MMVAKAAPAQCAPNTEGSCLYEIRSFRTGVASFTVVPRFYHMAQNCYLQAAMLTTIDHYQRTLQPAQPGVPTEWELDDFCTKPMPDGVPFNNAHVRDNVRQLYTKGSASSTLARLMTTYETAPAQGADFGKSVSQGTPEQFLSAIMRSELTAYRGYVRSLTRTPADFQEGKIWGLGVPGEEGRPSGLLSAQLAKLVPILESLDGEADILMAEVARATAEVVFSEFVRAYPEHLQWVAMAGHVRTVAGELDRLERALSALGIKLPDAFIQGN